MLVWMGVAVAVACFFIFFLALAFEACHSLICLQVLGEKGRRIRELTSVVQKRFNFPENGVELYAERVINRGLSAIAQVLPICVSFFPSTG